MSDLFVRMDDDLKHELDILAARESRTIKEIVIEQIENYIKTHKEGNPQHLLTQYQANEDFLGFPAIALSPQNKKKYIEKMPKKMIEDLQYHVQEWNGMLKES